MKNTLNDDCWHDDSMQWQCDCGVINTEYAPYPAIAECSDCLQAEPNYDDNKHRVTPQERKQ